MTNKVMGLSKKLVQLGDSEQKVVIRKMPLLEDAEMVGQLDALNQLPEDRFVNCHGLISVPISDESWNSYMILEYMELESVD